jgi:hypothetical protein
LPHYFFDLTDGKIARISRAIQSGTSTILYLAIEDIDHSHQDQEPADQWHLRALPQDRAQRILLRRVPQKGVPFELQADLDSVDSTACSPSAQPGISGVVLV